MSMFCLSVELNALRKGKYCKQLNDNYIDANSNVSVQVSVGGRCVSQTSKFNTWQDKGVFGYAQKFIQRVC